MKICRVEFSNHSVLGDLQLDFSIQDRPAETVYLIGDNGAGKTTILKEIETISQRMNFNSEVRDGCKEVFVILFYGYEIKRLFAVDKDDFDDDKEYLAKVTIDNGKSGWDALLVEGRGNTNQFACHGSLWRHDAKQDVFQVNYFEANPGYEYTKITGTTSLDLNPKKKKVASYREIAQLLVDVQSQDDSDYGIWSRANPELPRVAYDVESRIERFARAFNGIFKKEYHGLVTVNGEKKILFKDGDKYCDIGTLSSGEKQITLRACNLLRNVQDSAKMITLLDEPEVSLHPKLQLNIVKFYKDLFSDNAQQFRGQFIVSTHSPFILDQINHYTDKVIHIERSGGVTRIKDVADFYGWHDKKIITDSFSLDSSLLSMGTNILLEGETDEDYFKLVSGLLGGGVSGVEYKWVGRTISRGRSEFTGDSALNQTLAFSCAHPELIKGKLVLLYDNDTKKASADYGRVFVRVLPEADKSGRIKIGIESLLDLGALSLPIEEFWKKEEKIDGYGAVSIINKLNKAALCKHICEVENREDQERILKRLIVFAQDLESQIHSS